MPARTPFSAILSTNTSPLIGNSIVNSLKKLLFNNLTSGIFNIFSFKFNADSWLSLERLLKPFSPRSVKWIVNARLHSPEFVHIFDVAFSLLICCSLADNVSTKPFFPSTSSDSPTIRPGICLKYLFFVDNRPTYGPPKFIGLPRDWPSHATISAPIAPGDFTIPNDKTSVTTTISNAPLLWTNSAKDDKS